MNASGRDKLNSVLFCDEQTLVNVKFWPGTGRGLSSDALAEEAAGALQSARDAWSQRVPSKAPSTGMRKQSLLG